MRQRLFLILLCALALVGCDKHSEVESEESGFETAWPLIKNGHWANGYAIADTTKLPDSAGWYKAKDMGFERLDIGAEQFICLYVESDTYITSYSKKEQYEEIGNTIGDIGYDGYVKAVNLMVDPVTAIDITTTHDFDSSHKAGSSLADLMNVVYGTYDRFLRNGHRTDDTFHNIPGIQQEVDCKVALMKDAFKESFLTMYGCVYIYFKDKPEVTGEFPVEISYTFKSGVKHTQKSVIKL